MGNLIGAVVAVVGFAIAALPAVPAFFFLFRWEQMRDWFNERAGADFMPYNRINRRLLHGVVLVLMLVFVCPSFALLASVALGVVVPFLEDNLAILIPVAIVAYLAPLAIYIALRNSHRAKRIGLRAARWEMCYIFVTTVTIAWLVSISFGVFVFVIIFLILREIARTPLGSSSGGSSHGNDCCGNCWYYDYDSENHVGWCRARTVETNSSDYCSTHRN
mgnify:CR=1 FL=1